MAGAGDSNGSGQGDGKMSRNPGLKNAKTQQKSFALLAMERHPPPLPCRYPDGLEVGQEGVRCGDEGLVS